MNWFLLQKQNNYDDFQNNSNQFLELHEVDSRNDMENFGNVMVPSEMKHFLSWNAEEGIRVKENECADDISWVKNMESSDSRNNFKKRKAESILAEKTTEKCIKRDAEEESKVTENNSRGASEDTSKGNSKLPEVKKPDYIHVRARRGQATDSHSLAERARREKISKKMKCLQDLVPGCDKAMGKAGMLDEIINYVQSLQRQVEFLSMKLAALNPQIDFKCDDFLAKELPACLANFQGITSSPAITSLDINQLNPGQQGSLNISSLTNSSQEASQQILRSSVPFPELYLDPTCISQVHQFPVCDADFMRLFRMGFH